MAKFELKLPKMGESVAEATITSWLKDIGDTIEADEAVCCCCKSDVRTCCCIF